MKMYNYRTVVLVEDGLNLFYVKIDLNMDMGRVSGKLGLFYSMVDVGESWPLLLF